MVVVHFASRGGTVALVISIASRWCRWPSMSPRRIARMANWRIGATMQSLTGGVFLQIAVFHEGSALVVEGSLNAGVI